MKKVLLYLFLGISFFGKTQVTDSTIIWMEEKGIDQLEKSSIKLEDLVEAYIDSGQAAYRIYDYSLSLYYLDIAARLAQRAENPVSEAKALYYTGKAHYNFDKNAESERFFLLALDKYSIANDTDGVAKCYNVLGIVNKNMHHFDASIRYLNSSFIFYAALGDSSGMASSRLNKGNVFKKMGNFNYALSEYRSALKIYEMDDNLSSMADCYNNIGNVHRNMAQYDSAHYYMMKTLKLRKELDHVKGLAYIYHNLANLYMDQRKFDQALAYLDSSFAIKKTLNNPMQVAIDYESYGEAYYGKKDWNQSVFYFKKALDIFIEDRPPGWHRLHKSLGFAYYEQGNYQKSAQEFKNYFVQRDSTQLFSDFAEVETQLIRFELVKDSLVTAQDSLIKSQLALQKELVDAENLNKQLSNKVATRNFYLIISLLLILFFLSIRLIIRYRYRLKKNRLVQSRLQNQNIVLKKTSVPKEEKEILLKEVHHRVKNNFQIITSLVRLQSDYVNASNFKEKLNEIQNRIKSMSLIHEKLYKNDKISKLSVKEYLQDLCDHIMQSYETNAKIFFHFDIDEKELSIDTLIPLGLILNETISNSIKHGFYDRTEGNIVVSLKNLTNASEMKIEDDGIGADLTFDELKDESLGMDLVESLTDQLDGQFSLATSDGFKYSFTFPLLK